MIVTASARRMSRPVVTVPDPVVLIRSSAYASLPAPGNRIDPTDSANMPTIQASTGNPAFVTADGAHNFRLLGLNIKAPATLLQGAVVKIGGGETTLGEFPTDITVDRCIVQGDATNGLRRGVELDGIRCALVDSYVYDCKENGADSQAVWFYNTPGPVKVVNNYLEGAGENMMTGGQDPSYSNSVPSDLEIRRNYFKKQSAASWKTSWSIKNLLEFKNAQRVLVEGNVFDTCYADSQSGFGILVTPRNQGGNASWCVTQDITIRKNYLTNCEAGLNVVGDDNEQTSQRTYRVSVEHNLFEVVDLSQGGDRRLTQILRGPVDAQYIHNTFVFKSGSNGSSAMFAENGVDADRVIWRDNIYAAGSYGFIGTGTLEGDATLTGQFTNSSFTYNVLYGSSNSGDYTGTGNQFPAAATDVFTDFANADYTVKAAYQGDASDATDPGCDIAAMEAATANTIAGDWNDESTYTDQAYTNAELPRSYINTTYADQSGTEWIVTTAAEFTTALAGCAVGDIITLTAGNTFTGSFTLRNI